MNDTDQSREEAVAAIQRMIERNMAAFQEWARVWEKVMQAPRREG